MTKEKGKDVDSVAVLKIYVKRTPKGVLFLFNCRQKISLTYLTMVDIKTELIGM